MSVNRGARPGAQRGEIDPRHLAVRIDHAVADTQVDRSGTHSGAG
jgi:hypothetical protein